METYIYVQQVIKLTSNQFHIACQMIIKLAFKIKDKFATLQVAKILTGATL